MSEEVELLICNSK
ncbi:hypothetical protein L195_g063780, partial [Trifolium pratense]